MHLTNTIIYYLYKKIYCNNIIIVIFCNITYSENYTLYYDSHGLGTCPKKPRQVFWVSCWLCDPLAIPAPRVPLSPPVRKNATRPRAAKRRLFEIVLTSDIFRRVHRPP